MDEITPHLRAYVEQLSREWGRQVWRLWTSGEGYPARTLLARIIAEGLTGAGHVKGQRSWCIEGFSLHGQMVSCALHTLPGDQQTIFTVHYAIHAPLKTKYAVMRIPERNYWRSLKVARTRLAVEITAIDSVSV